MEYASAIVDELGDVMYWCSTLTSDEIDDILEVHTEWCIQCICISSCY